MQDIIKAKKEALAQQLADEELERKNLDKKAWKKAWYQKNRDRFCQEARERYHKTKAYLTAEQKERISRRVKTYWQKNKDHINKKRAELRKRRRSLCE